MNKRIFPTADQYETDEIVAGARTLVLETIGQLRSIMNAACVDPIVRQSQIVELEALGEELESLQATDEYLDQFTAEDGRFTAEARNTPEVMVKWIVHDVARMIRELPDMIDANGAIAMMGEFDDTHHITKGLNVGVIEGAHMPARLAEFAAKQQALTIYQDVLDARLNDEVAV